ncbi:hypothetical protein Tco_0543535 [Tanacetum coccineum]
MRLSRACGVWFPSSWERLESRCGGFAHGVVGRASVSGRESLGFSRWLVGRALCSSVERACRGQVEVEMRIETTPILLGWDHHERSKRVGEAIGTTANEDSTEARISSSRLKLGSISPRSQDKVWKVGGKSILNNQKVKMVGLNERSFLSITVLD